MSYKAIDIKLKKIILEDDIKSYISLSDRNIHYESKREWILFNKENDKIITISSHNSGRIIIDQRKFYIEDVKFYPYRKNSRKFIVRLSRSPLSMLEAQIIKFKIKKIGIKNFTLKQEWVTLEVSKKSWRYRDQKTQKRRLYTLTINDPAEFGIFCLHYSNLLEDKKFILMK